MTDISVTLEEGMDLLKEVPRSLSSTLSSDRSDGPPAHPSFKHSAYAILFVLIAWHYPRHLIHTETYIATKTPPYQETKIGDVILDFNLMNPVADPPTIPCKNQAYTQSPYNESGCSSQRLFCSQNPISYLSTSFAG